MSWSRCAVAVSPDYRWWTTLTHLQTCVPAAWFVTHNGPVGAQAIANC